MGSQCYFSTQDLLHILNSTQIVLERIDGVCNFKTANEFKRLTTLYKFEGVPSKNFGSIMHHSCFLFFQANGCKLNGFRRSAILLSILFVFYCSQICLTFLYLLCISLCSCQQDQPSNKNGLVRHKKKVVAVKKPLRSDQDTRSRQWSYSHSQSTGDDFAVTSKPSAISWEPITYSVFFKRLLHQETKPT